MTKHIANILTGYRILGSILLLFVPVFTVGFYTVYLLCGFGDMLFGNNCGNARSNLCYESVGYYL